LHKLSLIVIVLVWMSSSMLEEVRDKEERRDSGGM